MQKTPFRIGTLAVTTTTLAVAGLLLFSAAAAPAQTITVVFTPDDMGFTATSSKDISNIIVEFCDGSTHKHDMKQEVFVHTETQLIVGVWVKSGNNGIGGSAPAGAGERFDNAGVQCTTTSSSSSSTSTAPTSTSSSSSSTSDTSTSTSDTSSTTSDTSTTSETTTTSSSTSATTSTTSDTSSTTSGSETTTTTGSETTTTTSDTNTTTTEIPFFPSWTAIALGVGGVLASGFVMARRRL